MYVAAVITVVASGHAPTAVRVSAEHRASGVPEVVAEARSFSTAARCVVVLALVQAEAPTVHAITMLSMEISCRIALILRG